MESFGRILQCQILLGVAEKHWKHGTGHGFGLGVVGKQLKHYTGHTTSRSLGWVLQESS